jgi:hypothetical protein
MSVEKLDKIKKKINALLNKTVENGATEEEMTSALDVANKLMLEHYITENDLIKSKECIATKCKSGTSDLPKTSFITYEIFAGELAKLFDCEYYWNTKRKKITFFGFSVDVDLCTYFFEMIIKSVFAEKERFLRSEEYSAAKKLGYHGLTLSSSFIKGYLCRISSRMSEMYEDKKSNIPKSYSLVLVEKKSEVNKQFILEGLDIKTKKTPALLAVELASSIGISRAEEFKFTQGLEQSQKQKHIV